jgi:hypothetical protein
MMRLSPVLVLIAAVIVLIVLGVAGAFVLQPPRPLLADVSFSLNSITPNADGQDDVTIINYTLNRNADVTIRLTNTATQRIFVFRDAERRPIGTYAVGFSGVVDGFTVEGEPDGGVVEARLIPAGDYTWTVKADAEDGSTMQSTGTLTVADSDDVLPAMTTFEVSDTVFTPNQDGYSDRLTINVYLLKEATLTAYLTQPDTDVRYYINERKLAQSASARQGVVHQFDYDAGVDTAAEPPPDGDYTLVVIAEDKEGQRVRRETTITLENGGLPQAEIVNQSTGNTVTWATIPYNDTYYTDAKTAGTAVPAPEGVLSMQTTISFPKDDLLVFSLVVSNYGKTPIRTEGPWPGTVYQYAQTDGAMRLPESEDFSTGSFRIGIECERTTTSYPWRWALGSQNELTKVEAPNGQTLWYLMPGQKATVWGAIRMTTVIRTANPQKCWAGLIHQGVRIPFAQGHVGEVSVELETTEQP